MDNKSTPKSWKKAMENLKGRYPSLAEEDLIFEEDDQEELISHLQERLGKSQKEAEQIVGDMW